eukprot:1636745-Amphidinium_carterae.1
MGHAQPQITKLQDVTADSKSSDEGECFNCGSKSHALKECDKHKPTKRDPSKDAKDAKPSK